jgi:hypothetical protein
MILYDIIIHIYIHTYIHKYIHIYMCVRYISTIFIILYIYIYTPKKRNAYIFQSRLHGRYPRMLFFTAGIWIELSAVPGWETWPVAAMDVEGSLRDGNRTRIILEWWLIRGIIPKWPYFRSPGVGPAKEDGRPYFRLVNYYNLPRCMVCLPTKLGDL